VLPVAVGQTDEGTVANLIDVLWEVADMVIVSTDLSHYLGVEAARERDRRTAAAVVQREPESIGTADACGVYALCGLVEHARRRDLGVRLLDLRSSADTAGDPRRVVGYGAFAVG
jgi:AmmeMemoRadiSam system protein B